LVLAIRLEEELLAEQVLAAQAERIGRVDDPAVVVEAVSKPLQCQMNEAQIYESDVHERVVGPTHR
jgi:hypothetical protein